MSTKMPDTNDLNVAMIAAALELADSYRSKREGERNFDAHVSRFEQAFERVRAVVWREELEE